MTKPKIPGVRLPNGLPPRRFVEVGQRFGMSVVIDADVRIQRPPRPGRKSGDRGARLICECGNEFVTSVYALLDGNCASCGCGMWKAKWRDTPHRAARNALLGNYKGSARQRGLAWDLTGEDFDRLTSQDCHYCGAPPRAVRKSEAKYENGDFIYTGLDRKDSALGYTLENTLPCCTFCNRAKWARSYDEFMEWIARLTAYHWFNPEMTPSRRLKAVM